MELKSRSSSSRAVVVVVVVMVVIIEGEDLEAVVVGLSVWKAVLGPPTHPNLLLDEILIWIQVVAIHYWIGIGVVCPHCRLPTHNRFMMRRDGLQKGNSGKKATKKEFCEKS